MLFFADLHVHSRYSIATSKDSNLIELARWAALKGIRVVATGDFTHPKWREEIGSHLAPDGSGLYKLRKEYISSKVPVGPDLQMDDIRFILNVEISSIYKKDGKTRKSHNLVFMPDLDSVDKFNSRLDKIGNIKSDGRPILGLDARNLLEIALETCGDSFLIPAHIWTPWFSVLGSKSGFDSIQECYSDLSEHIFALETGLSSDPEMNRLVSSLDRYTLVSNSDTHSPQKLGREANIFHGEPGYGFIGDSLKSGLVAENDGMETNGFLDHAKEGFLGTLEFFPEEGKYHLDGHRKCDVRMNPEDTKLAGGVCPKCGNKITVGVVNRVMELADRSPGALDPNKLNFKRLAPLVEIISQAIGFGPKSKKTMGFYFDMVENVGSEMDILWARPLSEIQELVPEMILEGIRRVREGDVKINPGFDGQFGEVKLFEDNEVAGVRKKNK